MTRFSRPHRRRWGERGFERALESDRGQGVPDTHAHLALTVRHHRLHPFARRTGVGGFQPDRRQHLAGVRGGVRVELRAAALQLSHHLPGRAARIHHPGPDGRRDQRRARAADDRPSVRDADFAVLDHLGQAAGVDVVRHLAARAFDPDLQPGLPVRRDRARPGGLRLRGDRCDRADARVHRHRVLHPVSTDAPCHGRRVRGRVRAVRRLLCLRIRLPDRGRPFRHDRPRTAGCDADQPGGPAARDREQPAHPGLRDPLQGRLAGPVPQQGSSRPGRIVRADRQRRRDLQLGRLPVLICDGHDAALRPVRRLAVLAGEHPHAAPDLRRRAPGQRARAAAGATLPAVAARRPPPRPPHEVVVSSLDGVVSELRWSAVRSSALSYLLHAVLAAAAWILAVVIAARFFPLEQAPRFEAIGVPIAFVAVAVAWIAVRPGSLKLMRTGEVWLTLAVAVAAVGLVLLPNPMDQLLAQRRDDHAAQAQAAETVAAAQKKIAAASPAAQVDPQIQKILQDARARIASAPDPRAALQNITPAEQKLLQLSDPQTPARASTAQNLANNLSATNGGRAASQALNASPTRGARALRDLASQLQNLSPQDRAQLAHALATAAQQAKDPEVAASLQQASSALASGDVSAAATSMDALAGQLDSLQQQASQADRDAAGAGASASPSAGAGGSAGSGAGGSGNGTGNGTGSGNGSGTGNGGGGSGGTGGQGSSGSGAGQGTGAQSTERVYVPAAPIPGQSENDPAPLAPGQDVPLTPYDQVIQAYEQVALDAADQSLIPGSERDLVRSYFSSLGEQGGGR